MFSLVVDSFRAQYIDAADAEHLIETLQEAYKLHIDWTGADYVGLALEWDYNQRTVAVSMPGYVQKALARFYTTARKSNLPTRRRQQRSQT